MSDVPDLGLDLENLFQPSWAKDNANRFEKFTGNEGVKPERRGGDRPGRPGPRREGGFGGPPRGDRPPGGKRFGDRKGGPGRRDDRRGEGRGERRERPEPPAPLPEITVTFLPDEKGVEQLARQIRMTGRAYPLFQIAQLVLEKPERYSVQLGVKKKEGGAVAQPLFVCALDETPWLSEEEVVQHVLKNHFATFYQAERTPTDPPKGTYTFVAQCGMSGAILGPPNYHDYQNQLRKLHAERFSRMPFEAFKARVKIVKDEAVVKKWIEDLSFKTEYTALNVPEPLKLASMEDVEKHFRATHKDAIVKPVETLKIGGAPSRNLRNRELYRLIRTEWENQKYFPLQLATLLSKQFTSHGLQFFKVNKTVVHVSVARPQFLDLETTPVSEQIRRIVEFINGNPKCTRRKMIETLAPAPKPAVLEVKPDEPKVPSPAEPTPEQTALIADLHWLIHQGHVLEFADGRLETAKKPAPRPPKPEAKREEAAATTEATAEGAPEKPAEPVSAEPTREKASENPPPAESTPTEEVPSPS
jgi:hypothetical protein